MILLLKATNGLGFPCIHIGINTLILQNTEGSFIGRVGGVLTPMFMGMMVVGMALAGYFFWDGEFWSRYPRIAHKGFIITH
ncbi:hypothetical protein Elgi_63380 [Paenibacillus elgii]|nr:hypothetical protein Elgi_63380 [Paenibacillus elgii]